MRCSAHPLRRQFRPRGCKHLVAPTFAVVANLTRVGARRRCAATVWCYSPDCQWPALLGASLGVRLVGSAALGPACSSPAFGNHSVVRTQVRPADITGACRRVHLDCLARRSHSRGGRRARGPVATDSARRFCVATDSARSRRSGCREASCAHSGWQHDERRLCSSRFRYRSLPQATSFRRATHRASNKNGPAPPTTLTSM